jgi:hypothetical protein
MRAPLALACLALIAGDSPLSRRVAPLPSTPPYPQPYHAPDTDPAVARDPLGQDLKDLGVPPDLAWDAIDRVEAAARDGAVDEAAIGEAVASVEEAGARLAVERLLAEHAAWAGKHGGLPLPPAVRIARRADATPGREILPVDRFDTTFPSCPAAGAGSCSSPSGGTLVPVAAWSTAGPHVLSASGACAWFDMPVTVGNRYQLSTCNTISPGSQSDDVLLSVRLSNCATVIASVDDNCTSTGSAWNLAENIVLCPTATPIRVQVLNLGAPGNIFTLAYRDLGPCPCETCLTPSGAIPTPTTTCSPAIAATTDSVCPSEYRTVSLAAGNTYRFTACTSSCSGVSRSPSTYDPRLRLYGPGCALVAENDTSACGGVDPELVYTPLISGTHVLEITGTDAVAGARTLTYKTQRIGTSCPTCVGGPFVAFLPPPNGTCQSIAASLGACDVDWYRIALPAGVPVRFSTCPDLPSPCDGDTAFDTQIAVFSAGCGLRLLGYDDDDPSCTLGTASTVTFTPPRTGEYRIRVTGRPGPDRSYVLEWE